MKFEFREFNESVTNQLIFLTCCFAILVFAIQEELKTDHDQLELHPTSVIFKHKFGKQANWQTKSTLEGNWIELGPEKSPEMSEEVREELIASGTNFFPNIYHTPIRFRKDGVAVFGTIYWNAKHESYVCESSEAYVMVVKGMTLLVLPGPVGYTIFKAEIEPGRVTLYSVDYELAEAAIKNGEVEGKQIKNVAFAKSLFLTSEALPNLVELFGDKPSRILRRDFAHVEKRQRERSQ